MSPARAKAEAALENDVLQSRRHRRFGARTFGGSAESLRIAATKCTICC